MERRYVLEKLTGSLAWHVLKHGTPGRAGTPRNFPENLTKGKAKMKTTSRKRNPNPVCLIFLVCLPECSECSVFLVLVRAIFS